MAIQTEQKQNLNYDLKTQDVLDILVELGVIGSTEIQKFRKPTHGTCCTCQDCGWYHDECICGDNEIIEAIKKLQKCICEDNETIKKLHKTKTKN